MRAPFVTAILVSLFCFNEALQTHRMASRASSMSRRLPVRAVASLERPAATPLPKEDEWIGKLDMENFRQDIRSLGKSLEKGQGIEDVKHIKKICLWSNACAAFGIMTMWMPLNPLTPLTVFALSLWTFSRWTTIAHHTCHGGYNNADKTKFFSSKGFAIGSLKKRVNQWFDWMLPEAWNVEHNNLHHYRLGEVDDPDLVERNLEFVREMKAPMFVKYGAVAFLMGTWKWFYYAPNTYKELKIAELRRSGEFIPESDGPTDAFTLKAFVDHKLGIAESRKWYSFRDFMGKVAGPYLLGHFILLPLPLLFIKKAYFFNALMSLLLAEVCTNIHSFIAIATNHAGEDLYKFSKGCLPNSGTFYLRQVISSANFRTGSDINDFMHGWLNYQVEHHIWPNLSALSYQRAQPQVAAICEKYGVPYVQENVFIRLRKTVDIMVGKSSMREYPAEYELEADMKEWNVAAHKELAMKS